METVEEVPVQNTNRDSVKVNLIGDESATLAPDFDVCQTSNGVVGVTDIPHLELGHNAEKAFETPDNSIAPESPKSVSNVVSKNITNWNDQDAPDTDTDLTTALAVTAEILEKQLGDFSNISESSKQVESQQVDTPDEVVSKESSEIRDEVETFNSDNVTFETEIFVETNDNDINELNLNDTKPNVHLQESTNNILNELGQNLELSEALCGSDNADSNHNVGQEVFNKEELLDILEGKDIPTVDNIVEYEVHNKKSIETHIAMQQLSRLSMTKGKKTRSSGTMHVKKHISVAKRKSDPNRHVRDSKKNVPKSEPNRNIGDTKKGEPKSEPNKNIGDSKKDEPKSESKRNIGDSKKDESKSELNKNNIKESKKDECIINVLVKDWEDDELGDEADDDLTHNISTEPSEELVNVQECTASQVLTTETASVDSNDASVLNKSNEDGQPQRRLGRVIKKKVIFDPDNPDTFTKSKVHKIKQIQADKDETPSKKVKIEHSHRPKSKSPVSKLQWKKPPPKNIKQNKRLTEVDKLLMDEGAVNMIYQLTPEAPKGKKNMRTKAEFIKKIQSSTPESKEMKFRERKKETGRDEEGEAKKILGGKHRPSLSSIKSPSACDDFETHSADDSIIYRRHSSSSYSSTCMSPRRLSDVEIGVNQSTQLKASKDTDMLSVDGSADITDGVKEDVFIPDVSNISSGEIINKNDCLSIKEKLNSKLSLALNKRKRESSKTEKPVKQKKMKSEVKQRSKEDVNKYKHLMVIFDQRVAEICIQTTRTTINAEVLKELQHALEYVDTRKNTSVTLLTSECGVLWSELDLSPLMDEDVEKRNNSAYELAESIRSLLCTLAVHSKLVCCGASTSGACSGVALALLALSDVALASECTSFSAPSTTLQPGLVALSVRPQPLPQSLINDMVIFGRKLTASDALRAGLVSRVLWPDRFLEQLRSISRDIAAQPVPNLLLKKRLLNLNQNVSSTTFLSCLEKERDLIVGYWTSVEGQELLRASFTAVKDE